MFEIKGTNLQKYKSVAETHRLNISANNIFYQHIRLLMHNHFFSCVDRYLYTDIFQEELAEIKLQTSPIDMIKFTTPTDLNSDVENEEDEKLFVLNNNTPEYKAVIDIMTKEHVLELLNVTSAAAILVKDTADGYQKLIDDLLVNFCIYKYSEQIELIRLKDISNATELVQDVVNNITEKDLHNYLTAKKVNPNKVNKYWEDIVFEPELKMLTKFYSTNETITCDLKDILTRLMTNVVCKSDIYIIIAIYVIFSFAMVDISNNYIEESPCAKYVINVLSKI